MQQSPTTVENQEKILLKEFFKDRNKWKNIHFDGLEDIIWLRCPISINGGAIKNLRKRMNKRPHYQKITLKKRLRDVNRQGKTGRTEKWMLDLICGPLQPFPPTVRVQRGLKYGKRLRELISTSTSLPHPYLNPSSLAMSFFSFT